MYAIESYYIEEWEKKKREYTKHNEHDESVFMKCWKCKGRLWVQQCNRFYTIYSYMRVYAVSTRCLSMCYSVNFARLITEYGCSVHTCACLLRGPLKTIHFNSNAHLFFCFYWLFNVPYISLLLVGLLCVNIVVLMHISE